MDLIVTTCADDVVAGLEGGCVLVLVRTMEEGGQFALVLPDVPLEVFSCGGMISAHLCKSGHETSVDVFEPLWWSEAEKF